VAGADDHAGFPRQVFAQPLQRPASKDVAHLPRVALHRLFEQGEVAVIGLARAAALVRLVPSAATPPRLKRLMILRTPEQLAEQSLAIARWDQAAAATSGSTGTKIKKPRS
jgi:hypothetical protein